jgi:hypothetical protein
MAARGALAVGVGRTAAGFLVAAGLAPTVEGFLRRGVAVAEVPAFFGVAAVFVERAEAAFPAGRAVRRAGDGFVTTDVREEAAEVFRAGALRTTAVFLGADFTVRPGAVRLPVAFLGATALRVRAAPARAAVVVLRGAAFFGDPVFFFVAPVFFADVFAEARVVRAGVRRRLAVFPRAAGRADLRRADVPDLRGAGFLAISESFGLP